MAPLDRRGWLPEKRGDFGRPEDRARHRMHLAAISTTRVARAQRIAPETGCAAGKPAAGSAPVPAASLVGSIVARRGPNAESPPGPIATALGEQTE